MVVLLLGAYAAKKASLLAFRSLPTLNLGNTSSQAAPHAHRAFVFTCVSPAPDMAPGELSVNGLCLRSSDLHHCVLVDNDPTSLTSFRDLRDLLLSSAHGTHRSAPLHGHTQQEGHYIEGPRCLYTNTWELISCCRAGYWLLLVLLLGTGVVFASAQSYCPCKLLRRRPDTIL